MFSIQKTYIGFLAPKVYEWEHGCSARNFRQSDRSITSRELYKIELILNIKKKCNFKLDAVDDLNQYNDGHIAEPKYRVRAKTAFVRYG